MIKDKRRFKYTFNFNESAYILEGLRLLEKKHRQMIRCHSDKKVKNEIRDWVKYDIGLKKKIEAPITAEYQKHGKILDG